MPHWKCSKWTRVALLLCNFKRNWIERWKSRKCCSESTFVSMKYEKEKKRKRTNANGQNEKYIEIYQIDLLSKYADDMENVSGSFIGCGNSNSQPIDSINLYIHLFMSFLCVGVKKKVGILVVAAAIFISTHRTQCERESEWNNSYIEIEMNILRTKRIHSI